MWEAITTGEQLKSIKIGDELKNQKNLIFLVNKIAPDRYYGSYINAPLTEQIKMYDSSNETIHYIDIINKGWSVKIDKLNDEVKRLINESKDKLNKKVVEVRKKKLARPNTEEIITLENNLKNEIIIIEKFYSTHPINNDNISLFRKEIGDVIKAIDTVFS